METVETLTKGNVLLVAGKGVNGDKVQLEFAEFVDNPNSTTSNSIVADLNKSDARFSSRKPKRAWVSGNEEDILAIFGVDLSSLTKGESKELNILNPKIGDLPVHVQITESTDPNKWQMANKDLASKRAGAGGAFLLHNGKRIFVNATVVKGVAKNTFLPIDALPVAEPVVVETTELETLSA